MGRKKTRFGQELTRRVTVTVGYRPRDTGVLNPAGRTPMRTPTDIEFKRAVKQLLDMGVGEGADLQDGWEITSTAVDGLS